MADTKSKGTEVKGTAVKDKPKGRLNPIQVQKFLKGVGYPASKKDLLQKAKANGADEQMLSQLNNLPEQTYDRPTGVTRAVGKLE